MDPQHQSFAAVAKGALSLGISKSEGKGVRHEVSIETMASPVSIQAIWQFLKQRNDHLRINGHV